MRLEPLRLEWIEALVEGDAMFNERFGITVVEGWAGFPEALPHALDAARRHDVDQWGSHLFFDDDGALVGFGGFKGPPANGDKLEMIAGFTAQATPGQPATVRVATTAPARHFVIDLTADGATLTPASDAGDADLVLPAEALVRLVYGRLDPDHTPPIAGDPALVDRLRATFPGV